MPHLYCMIAQGLVDLYAEAWEDAYRRVEEVWPALKRSLVLRVNALAVIALRMRAATAIAAARIAADPGPLLAIAERDARAMERQSYSTICTREWPKVLRAGIAAARGKRATAIDLLGSAMDGFRACDAAFFLAIAGRKKGELLGGKEGRALVTTADSWMAGEGIVHPARLAAALAPVFQRAGVAARSPSAVAPEHVALSS